MAPKIFFVAILAVFAAYCTADFDDAYARQMINFAAASFIDPVSPNAESLAKQCFTKSFPNSQWTLETIHNIKPCASFASDTCQYLIARSDSLNLIVIAFRGTVGKDQMDNEAHESLQDYVEWNVEPGVAHGRVNKYFYNAAESVWSAHVEPILRNYPNYKIAFTGHSLGGAIASLTAVKARILGYASKMTLYTFGEPRLGDNSFAETYKYYIPEGYRVIHNSDLVPHLPPCDGILFASCEKKDGRPYHQPREVWYNNKDLLMKERDFKVCDEHNGEDPHCSNSYSEFEFGKNLATKEGADLHIHYYEHKLDDYGPAGCNSAITYGFSVIALSLFFIQRLFLH